MQVHARHFRRIQPAINEYRFYDLRLERDLWGTWIVTRRWGRIGVCRPHEMNTPFTTYHDARQEYRDQVHHRHKRGYHTK